MSWPPIQRSDCKDVCRLVDHLRQLAKPEEWVFVVGSSVLINNDLIGSAERQTYGFEGTRLRLYPSPHIDSRDFYPLEGLFAAKYVVLAQPHQFHMSPDHQRVVSTAGEAFVKAWEIAACLRPCPRPMFSTRARPYESTGGCDPLPSTCRVSLSRSDASLHACVLPTAGGLAVPARAATDASAYRSALSCIQFDESNRDAELVYLDRLPCGGAGRFCTFCFLDQQSRGVQVELVTVRSDGQMQRCGERYFAPGQAGDFRLPFDAAGGERLVLTVVPREKEPNNRGNCMVCLSSLQVERDLDDARTLPGRNPSLLYSAKPIAETAFVGSDAGTGQYPFPGDLCRESKVVSTPEGLASNSRTGQIREAQRQTLIPRRGTVRVYVTTSLHSETASSATGRTRRPWPRRAGGNALGDSFLPPTPGCWSR